MMKPLQDSNTLKSLRQHGRDSFLMSVLLIWQKSEGFIVFSRKKWGSLGVSVLWWPLPCVIQLVTGENQLPLDAFGCPTEMILGRKCMGWPFPFPSLPWHICNKSNVFEKSWSKQEMSVSNGESEVFFPPLPSLVMLHLAKVPSWRCH